jgi:hypothetical protein
MKKSSSSPNGLFMFGNYYVYSRQCFRGTAQGARAMRNVTKEQMPVKRENDGGTIVRTLITAVVMTGWMVLTGCSYLKTSEAHIKQTNACYDQGRSGYWCPGTTMAVTPDASSKKAAEISDERGATQKGLPD